MANNNTDKTFVLRLQSDNVQHDLSNTIKHWDESHMYDNKQIDAIESTNKNSLHQPTSIPSPFARIALVKTAFSEVAEHGDKALAAYQKIVSDSLDVAEIFFTFDKWKDRIEIITWKYGKKENSPDFEDDSDLKKLEKGHRLLYKTLKTFLENDAQVYNFDKMRCIYILKYKQTGDMIGATSPCTLFFSSASDNSNIHIQLASDRKAFEGIKPLCNRNWSFQKYIYSWFAANKESRIIDGRETSCFHEFQNYLETQKSIARTEDIDKLETISRHDLLKAYIELRSPNVEVLGKPLYQIKEIQADSLVANDILEDTIIRLPYEIRKEDFFDGNLPKNSKQTYLLPIKEKFFHFFSIEDLKKYIRLNHSGDVVEVELTIGQNKHKKRYTKSNGTIIELTFDCAIFPNVRFENDELAYYRFGIVCDFKEKEKYSAEFVKINTSIEQSRKRYSVRNETHSLNYQLKNYSLEGSNFDYIRVNYNGVYGIIIPKLETKTGNNTFTIAIDFGTTNTHIEYKINDGKDIKIFNISKEPVDEKQVHCLHGGEDDINRVFDEEYIPPYTDEEFKFPMRTALSYGEMTNWLNVYPFEKTSFNELYEKYIDLPYNTTETDLKWSDKENYKEKVVVYIKSLMYMLRNKVVISKGDLKKTKIIWFYPVSMEKGRYENLENAWKVAYSQFFGGNPNNIISLTESVAPFEYYVRDRNAKNLVTIDIGGGTTDVVISVNGKADYITSFRFAANSVFGDGYAETNRVKNGIVRQFYYEIKEELQTIINETDSLFEIFKDMYDKRSSDNIASFLFSLSQNKTVRLKGQNLAENTNLSKKLIDDTSQKITFIFFYAAIIYHLAKLMKAEELQMPDKIVFSGNGSRVIQFLTDDSETLKRFTKLIFENVFGIKYHSNDLIIERNVKNPKEATCKGGLFVKNPDSYREILRKKVVLHSNGTDKVIHRVFDLNKEIDKLNKYSVIDDEYLKHTMEESKKFIQFVFDLLPFFNSEGYKLNTTYVNLAKKLCFNRLDIYTQNGWEQKRKDIDLSEIIDETLFFYPLVGMLNSLSSAIADFKNEGPHTMGYKQEELFN